MNAKQTVNAKANNGWKTLAVAVVMALIGPTITNASDFVLVIDTSGSMQTSVAGKGGKSRIEVVQTALANYLSALQADSRVKLISFNDRLTELEFTLHTDNDRKALLESVTSLRNEPKRNGGTKLYSTMRRALAVAREYAKQNPGQLVDLRILTDGEDDSRKPAELAIPEILREYPEVDQKTIRPNLVLCGDWSSSLIVRLDQKLQPLGMEVTDASNMSEPMFPPVIIQSPDPAELARESMFADNSATVFARYEWTIDGNAAGRGKSLMYKFTDTNVHHLVLLGITPSGKRLRAEKIARAVAPGLAVDFAISATTVEPGEEIRLFGRPFGKVEKWTWLADGKPIADTQDAAVKFTETGEHTIKVIVADGFKAKAEVVKSVLVRMGELSVDFAVSVSVVELNQEVRVFGRPMGKVEKWSWLLDGKPIADTQDAVIKFTEIGEHTIKVIVADAFNAKAEAIKTVMVRVSEFGVDFKASNQAVEKAPVQFAFECIGRAQSITWSFGDNTTSNERNPVHVFRLSNSNTTQDFTIVVKATDDHGQTSSAQHVIRIVPERKDAAPKAAFSIKGGHRHKAGDPIQLLNESIGTVNRLVWTLGNESTNYNANPEVILKAAGEKPIRLTVWGPGGTDSIEQIIVILPRYTAPSIAKVAALPARGVAPAEVTFTAQTTGDVAKVVWKFADGKTVEGVSVKHTVNSPGDFTAEAIVVPIDPEHARAKAKVTFHAKAPMPGWVWFVAGLTLIAGFAAFAWSKFKPQPLFGTLSWMDNGQEKKVSLSGTCCDLTRILPPGVTNGSRLEVRNRGGICILKDGTILRRLKKGDRFKSGSINLAYNSDL